MADHVVHHEYKVPDFGRAIQRPRFLQGLDSERPSVIVLSSPGGYGKSVLATQIVDEGNFFRAVWIEAARLDSDSESLLRALWESLNAVGLDSQVNALCPIRPAGGHGESEDTSGCSVCVVFDDIREFDVVALTGVAEVLRSATGSDSVVVGTTRDEVSIFGGANVRVIPSSCLELNEHEARELVSLYSRHEWTEDQRCRLIQSAGRWPALLSVLARQASLTDLEEVISGSVPADVYTHLRALAREQLSDEDIRVLKAMSLMGHGTITQLRRVVGGVSDAGLARIASVLPLVRLDSHLPQARVFRVHDLAIAAFSELEEAEDTTAEFKRLVHAVCDELDAAGRFDEVLTLSSTWLDSATVVYWTEKRGRQVLASGGMTLLLRILDDLGPGALLQNSRLLLLHAELLRETSAYFDALSRAAVARDIAKFEDDVTTLCNSLITMGRLQIDLGKMVDAATSFQHALALTEAEISNESRVLAEAYLGLCMCFAGNWSGAERHAREADRLSFQTQLSGDAAMRVATFRAVSLGLVGGRWDEVLSILVDLQEHRDLSLTLSLQSRGNLGAVLVELGRLPRAESVLASTLSSCKEYGLQWLELSYRDTMGAVQAGFGRYALADDLVDEAIAGFESLGDRLEVAHILTYQSNWTRVQGDFARALEMAERALEYSSTLDCTWLTWSAISELAACLCGLGDSPAAECRASQVRHAAKGIDARRYWLSADMVLAEVARRQGRPEEGIARFMEHEDYILTESANWQIAMYVRAFPHILGMLAAALGPDALPVHLLRMVLPQDAERILAACGDILDEDTWRRLAARIVGEGDTLSLERMRDTPQCYVRFFGGLEVRIGDRSVPDKQWRKRKARMLFAILVANRGREMPREQLFDQLWPEMDEVRARNNYYVIWSAMKAALIPGATKATPCPYVDNTGGMCRVVRDLVTSDIDEFEIALAEASAAEKLGDTIRAIRFYEQVVDIYRGELLPGDIYEDWFAQMRDGFRVEFGDAMLRASELLGDEGENARALLMVRRGLRADPWREDLYQAALALQITLGQRSAAVETYTVCRRRLADDLGLDPSSETMRLYQQVLAMEDGIEASAADAETSEDD